MRAVFNVVLQSVNWTVTVIGVAKGYPYLGLMAVGLTLPIHFYFIPNRKAELTFMLICTLFGSVFDSLLVLLGAIELGESALFGMFTAPWMVGLWLNFMTLPNVSLKWLRGKTPLAVGLGATLGPAAYFWGSKLGAITFHENIYFSLFFISLEWALAMLFIFKLQKRMVLDV